MACPPNVNGSRTPVSRPAPVYKDEDRSMNFTPRELELIENALREGAGEYQDDAQQAAVEAIADRFHRAREEGEAAAGTETRSTGTCPVCGIAVEFTAHKWNPSPAKKPDTREARAVLGDSDFL